MSKAIKVVDCDECCNIHCNLEKSHACYCVNFKECSTKNEKTCIGDSYNPTCAKCTTNAAGKKYLPIEQRKKGSIYIVNLSFEISNLSHIWSQSKGLEKILENSAEELKTKIIESMKYHFEEVPYSDNSYKLLKIEVRKR